MGSVRSRVGDTVLKTFTWMDSNGNVLQSASNRLADSITGIGPGKHVLHMSKASGCDTSLYFTMKPIPSPVADFWADTIVC